jgi:hypothetical protein
MTMTMTMAMAMTMTVVLLRGCESIGPIRGDLPVALCRSWREVAKRGTMRVSVRRWLRMMLSVRRSCVRVRGRRVRPVRLPRASRWLR